VKKKIKDIIRESREVLSTVDVYYLLSFILNRSKEFLFTYPDFELSRREMSRWERAKNDRLRGVPAAYITGIKEFYSLRFWVNQNTLIPRPETEILVDEILQLYPKKFLDMGTGSGCIAVSVKSNLKDCMVTGCDRSRKALKIAEKNTRELTGKGTIKFIRSNYFNNLPMNKFEVIASNPPYVRSGELAGIIRYEPVYALDGGPDGLDAYKILISESPRFLLAGGKLVLEISPELKEGILRLTESSSLRTEKIEKDLSGHDRMIVLRESSG